MVIKKFNCTYLLNGLVLAWDSVWNRSFLRVGWMVIHAYTQHILSGDVKGYQKRGGPTSCREQRRKIVVELQNSLALSGFNMIR